jgi:cell division protein FtsB
MARSAAKSDSVLPRRIKQVVVVGGVLAALVFAVQGGEYGTRDLMRQRERRAVLTHTNDSLQRIIDSLRTYKHRHDTDPALQERIAREEIGMLRGNKEILYRFTEPEAP